MAMTFSQYMDGFSRDELRIKCQDRKLGSPAWRAVQAKKTDLAIALARDDDGLDFVQTIDGESDSPDSKGRKSDSDDERTEGSESGGDADGDFGWPDDDETDGDGGGSGESEGEGDGDESQPPPDIMFQAISEMQPVLIPATQVVEWVAQALPKPSPNGDGEELDGSHTVWVARENEKPKKLDGTSHYLLAMALELLMIEHLLFLVGPAGSGKSELARQLADILKVPFYFESFTAGVTESAVVGRILATGAYMEARFVKAFRDGGLFLADEYPCGDPNTIAAMNAPLANGHMALPNGEIIQRHKDFYFVAAGNIDGNEYSTEYVATSKQDAASLDRFCMERLVIDYDASIEKRVIGLRTRARKPRLPAKVETSEEMEVEAKRVYVALKAIRKNIDRYDMRRIVSTRAFVKAGKLIHKQWTASAVIRQFQTGWQDSEIEKALEGIELDAIPTEPDDDGTDEKPKPDDGLVECPNCAGSGRFHGGSDHCMRCEATGRVTHANIDELGSDTSWKR
jgi:MoxR-like ATPase